MSTLYLPAWSIGPDCYKEVYEIVRPYGKKVAVIGGHTALSVAMPKLKAALEGTDLELTDPSLKSMATLSGTGRETVKAG